MPLIHRPRAAPSLSTIAHHAASTVARCILRGLSVAPRAMTPSRHAVHGMASPPHTPRAPQPADPGSDLFYDSVYASVVDGAPPLVALAEARQVRGVWRYPHHVSGACMGIANLLWEGGAKSAKSIVGFVRTVTSHGRPFTAYQIAKGVGACAPEPTTRPNGSGYFTVLCAQYVV